MTGETGVGSDPSIAVAHWHVSAWGGAEYLVSKMAEAVGVDRVYTIGDPSCDEPNPYGDVKWIDVSTGPGALIKRYVGRPAEYALWEDVDWREYGNPDVLLTSGGTTRAVLTPDDTLHINYCHSPPRWFYDLYHDRKSSLAGVVGRPLVRYLRTRDAAIDRRVDCYLANSPNVARRISKYYDRKSTVLYPPVDLTSYRAEHSQGFYLHLGRLDEEKGVEAIVRAFESRDEQIVFAGGRGDVDQSVVGRIERADNMEYEGFVSQDRKYDLLATCEAIVFNARNEDFGIVPIEANASAKPCLARNEGFPATFVVDGHNGFKHDGTPSGIGQAIEQLETAELEFDPDDVIREFSTEAFRRQLLQFVSDQYRSFQSRFEGGLRR
jgi:glycosyltransferase involved in cell wall biosynthesis